MTFILCLSSFIHQVKLHHWHWWAWSANRLTGRNTGGDTWSESYLYSITFLSRSGVLHRFLHDALRAGKYYLSGEMYADASLNCLNYIACHRLALPINVLHGRRYITARRTSPHKTRQLLKYLEGRRMWKEYFRLNHIVKWSRYRDLCFPKLAKRCDRIDVYSAATKLVLQFLLEALQLSAKSDALIALAKAEKPFSQRALQYPALVKKCRAALAVYLARVEGADVNEPR